MESYQFDWNNILYLSEQKKTRKSISVFEARHTNAHQTVFSKKTINSLFGKVYPLLKI